MAKTISLTQSLPDLSDLVKKHTDSGKLAPVHIAKKEKKLHSLVAM